MREAEIIKLENSKVKENYEQKLFNLEKSREKALIDAQREAKMLIRDAKEEADSILKNMRELEKMGFSSDARQKLEEQRKRLREKMDSVEDKVKTTSTMFVLLVCDNYRCPIVTT